MPVWQAWRGWNSDAWYCRMSRICSQKFVLTVMPLTCTSQSLTIMAKPKAITWGKHPFRSHHGQVGSKKIFLNLLLDLAQMIEMQPQNWYADCDFVSIYHCPDDHFLL
uniref:Uncharacterized protein n=1 Tax=Eutreptiella gymnastica TaxID=73025 RepID=A0A7S1NTX8_9EUGL